jgi:hypothetical protein
MQIESCFTEEDAVHRENEKWIHIKVYLKAKPRNIRELCMEKE